MAKTTVTPTKGEALFIWRRRRGLRQVEEAANRGVHPDVYRDWEADRRPDTQPRQQLGPLKPHEMCVLLRRRAGMKQKELAQILGCTRLWVIKMEEGTAPSGMLREYWGV